MVSSRYCSSSRRSRNDAELACESSELAVDPLDLCSASSEQPEDSDSLVELGCGFWPREASRTRRDLLPSLREAIGD